VKAGKVILDICIIRLGYQSTSSNSLLKHGSAKMQLFIHSFIHSFIIQAVMMKNVFVVCVLLGVY